MTSQAAATKTLQRSANLEQCHLKVFNENLITHFKKTNRLVGRLPAGRQDSCSLFSMSQTVHDVRTIFIGKYV